MIGAIVLAAVVGSTSGETSGPVSISTGTTDLLSISTPSSVVLYHAFWRLKRSWSNEDCTGPRNMPCHDVRGVDNLDLFYSFENCAAALKQIEDQVEGKDGMWCSPEQKMLK